MSLKSLKAINGINQQGLDAEWISIAVETGQQMGQQAPSKGFGTRPIGDTPGNGLGVGPIDDDATHLQSHGAQS